LGTISTSLRVFHGTARVIPGRVAAVIASEAKQSSQRFDLDCFVAEFVIGPATSGRTRWLLAMTLASELQNMHALAPAIDQIEPAGIVGANIV
jgi:ATP-dependent protease Clp ATPase subunit